jgi:hypothetical protein
VSQLATRHQTCEACGREFVDALGPCRCPPHCPHCRHDNDGLYAELPINQIRQLIEDLLACETLRYWERRLVEAISCRLETGELPLPDGQVSSLFDLWDRRGQALAAPSRPTTATTAGGGHATTAGGGRATTENDG